MVFRRKNLRDDSSGVVMIEAAGGILLLLSMTLFFVDYSLLQYTETFLNDAATSAARRAASMINMDRVLDGTDPNSEDCYFYKEAVRRVSEHAMEEATKLPFITESGAGGIVELINYRYPLNDPVNPESTCGISPYDERPAAIIRPLEKAETTDLSGAPEEVTHLAAPWNGVAHGNEINYFLEKYPIEVEMRAKVQLFLMPNRIVTSRSGARRYPVPNTPFVDMFDEQTGTMVAVTTTASTPPTLPASPEPEPMEWAAVAPFVQVYNARTTSRCPGPPPSFNPLLFNQCIGAGPR